MIYADEVFMYQNGKLNPDESYTNKCQIYVDFSFGYKLACVDGQFIKPFESYLGHDVVHRFISNMVEESKYCNHGDNLR